MHKSCKTTFYAHLSQIWKLARFMRFIQKVFASKILLSGKFSLFVTLWPAVLSRTVPRIETKWPGSGKFAFKITSLETHLLIFSNPNFVKQDLSPRSETVDWVWWQPDEKRTALPSPCSPWTKYWNWRMDWGEECYLMSEKQHISANKFGLSELAKCRKEMLFLLGVEAVIICKQILNNTFVSVNN